MTGWTTTPPTTPGWYWLDDGRGWAGVVSVAVGPGTRLGVVVTNVAVGWTEQRWTRLEEFPAARWAGPLEPPA